MGTFEELRGEKWRRLQMHRERAATFRLGVLVWGPADDGSPEYAARVKIRDALLARGDDARFSEELAAAAGALKDPIDDETLQAVSADVIVMLYGSRGTQTERDMILTMPEVAAKSIVLIEESMYDVVRRRSLAAVSWDVMSRVARILTYVPADLPDGVVAKACDLMQEFRVAYYVRKLRSGGL